MTGDIGRRVLRALGLAVAFALCVARAYAAPGDKDGETQMCIPASSIRETTVINSRTIFVRMNGRDSYKRIDLATDCPSLNFHGFSYSTSIDRLCVSDPLRVVEPVGEVCMMSKIVTIDPQEAKTLLASRKN